MRKKTIIAQPEPPSFDNSIPLCHLLIEPASLQDSIHHSLGDLQDHIIICTENYDLFKLICTLRFVFIILICFNLYLRIYFIFRASHIKKDFKPIVFLCHRPPTPSEFETLCVFPSISYVIGDPSRRRDLKRAGIARAYKVVITCIGHDDCDEFRGSSSMYVILCLKFIQS
jgi:hypothetical protein